jgi:adenylosuccinate lyase
MEAWASGGDFRARIAADPEVQWLMSPEQIGEVFKLERYLKHVDALFARVFDRGGEPGRP